MFGLRLAHLALFFIVAPLCMAAAMASQADDDDALVSVLVVDGDGEPLHGAWVYVYMTADQCKTAGIKGGFSQSGMTDFRGKASMRIAPSHAQTLVIQMKDGHGEVIKRVIEGTPPGSTLELEETLRLRNDTVFSGLLIDSTTGAPVTDAVIDADMHCNLIMLGTQVKTLRPSSRRAAKGKRYGTFTLPAATFTKTDLRIFAPGYTPRFLTVGGAKGAPGIEGGASAGPLPIKLEKSAKLQVSLVDAPAGISVEAVFPCAALDPTEAWTDVLSVQGEIVENDATNGSFVYFLDGLPSVTDVELQFKQRDRVVKKHEVRTPIAGGETRVTFELSMNGRIEGTLLDESGAPVGGAEVWVGESPAGGPFRFPHGEKPLGSATTDALGQFSFAALTAGEYLVAPRPLIRPIKPFPAFVTPGVRCRLSAETKTLKATLRAQKALTIEGTLLDHAGAPCRGRISADRVDGRWSESSATSAADGAFHIGGLLPGTYALTAHVGLGLPGIPIDVAAGARNVKVKVPATGVISGTVVDATTCHPVPDAEVRFQDSRTGEQLAERSNTDGRFAFKRATVGEHQLIAWTPDGRITGATPVRLDLEGPLDDVVLRLNEGAVLEISPPPADDRTHVSLVTGSGPRLHGSAPMGGPVRMTVPAGTLDVRVYQVESNLEARLTVTLKPGDVLKKLAELLPIKKVAPNSGDR